MVHECACSCVFRAYSVLYCSAGACGFVTLCVLVFVRVRWGCEPGDFEWERAVEAVEAFRIPSLGAVEGRAVIEK